MEKELTAYEYKALKRIMDKIIPVPESGCWLWNGAQSNGYGQFGFYGKMCRAHRVMWELTNGPIPDGLWVLHSCDVPACVRPEHLHLGTHADNMRECIERSRTRHGEEHGSAKLTESNVYAIRSSARSNADLARELHVNHRTIGDVRSGRCWGTENIKDWVHRGPINRGENNGSARLTEPDVRAIRNSTRTTIDWMRELNVSHGTIDKIKNRKTWGWLE